MKTDEKKELNQSPKLSKNEESKVNEEEDFNSQENIENQNANEVSVNDQELLGKNQSSVLSKENKKSSINNEENLDEPVENFQFREKLLTNEVHKTYGNRLREDYKYDNEGDNGLFEAKPRIVKIAGFEIGKKIMTKIIIINKSKYSERIIILPPTTENFKIKYTKRGQIPPGLNETIYLYFTPNEYKYYTDNICINCPGSKIIIPIHAYPKMNMFAKEYIPKIIDFGNVNINTTQNKNIAVNNLIDLDFKYAINSINSCNEIKIEPMKGVFEKMNNNIIKVTISPKKYGIFRGEYEFKINEIDFQPYTFTVFATCNSFETSNIYNAKYLPPLKETKPVKRIEKEDLLNVNQIDKAEPNLDKKEKRITLTPIDQKNLNETLKSEYITPANNTIIKENVLTENEDGIKNRSIKTPIPNSPCSNTNKKPENEEVPNNELQNSDNDLNKPKKNEKTTINLEDSAISNDITRPESKILTRFKDMPSSKEKEFLQYYNTNDEKIQAKEFKYIRFIGKEPLNEKQTNDLLNERNTALQNIVDFNCQMDKNRHKPELDKEKCVIDRDHEFYLRPNFNTNQNDNFFKTRHYFKLFLKGLTKIVMRKRADDRLKAINDMLTKNNIKTRDDFAKYCDKDWIEFFSKDQQSAEDEKNFNFLQMKFIPPQLVYREKIWLTNEYSINSLKQNIPHENNINLDEYDPVKELERNDLQVINYNQFTSPGLTQFDMNLGEKKLRPACESENLIREDRGDSELDPLKHSEYFDIADSHLQHLFTEPEDLIFTNPVLKNYKVISNMSESSTDYNLQPRPIKECYVNNSSYQNDLYMDINISFTDNDKIRTRTVDKENLYLDNSINFNFNQMKKLAQSDQKDLYIKKNEKVDEDNFIYELIKDDDKAIIDMIEKEDNDVKNVRDLNKYGTFDVRKKEKIELEKRMLAIKKKWMSLVPTYIEYINSGIKDPSNKLMP